MCVATSEEYQITLSSRPPRDIHGKSMTKYFDPLLKWKLSKTQYASVTSKTPEFSSVLKNYLNVLKGIFCNISVSKCLKTTRLLLKILLSCVYASSECFRQCSNFEKLWLTQGNGAFHVVAFRGNIRWYVSEWGRMLVNMSKHNVNQALKHYLVCKQFCLSHVS